jgi:hypothetical protein
MLLSSANCRASHDGNISLTKLDSGLTRSEKISKIKQCPIVGPPWRRSGSVFANPSTLIDVDYIEMTAKIVKKMPKLIYGAPTDRHLSSCLKETDLSQICKSSYYQLTFKNQYIHANRHGLFITRQEPFGTYAMGTIIISLNYNIYKQISQRIIPHPLKALYFSEQSISCSKEIGRYCLIRGEEAPNSECKAYPSSSIRRFAGDYNSPISMFDP